MKLNTSAKSLTLTASALGLMVLVPFANIAMAQTSSPSPDVIDLSIDVNQDGISDQLLAATQESIAIEAAARERLLATTNTDPNFNESFDEQAYEIYLAIAQGANMQLAARMPYSENAKQMIARGFELADQYDRLYVGEGPVKWGMGGPEQTALEAEMTREGELRDNEPSIRASNEAQTKVYQFLGIG
jgi:hypothetical protein